MTYLDAFLAPVPHANRSDYEALARLSAVVLQECGALRVVESWLDDSGPDASTYHGDRTSRATTEYPGFLRAAAAAAGETVVLSWVEWPDKASRDAGMERFTSDPRVQFEGQPPVFDGARLIAGGFLPMLEQDGRGTDR